MSTPPLLTIVQLDARSEDRLAPPAEIEAASGGTMVVRPVASGGGSRGDVSEALRMAENDLEAPFVVLGSSTTVQNVAPLMERVALLLAHPGTVMAFGPTALAGGRTVIEADAIPRWATQLAPAAGIVQGRELLLQMLACAQNVVGLPGGTVIRTAALRGRSARNPLRFTAPTWHLELWARLLVSGQVAYSPTWVGGMSDATVDTADAELAWWPVLIEESRRLGVLDEDAAYQAAVVAYDQRYQAALRSGLVSGSTREAVSGARGRMLVRFHDAASWNGRRLPVHAVVVHAPGQAGPEKDRRADFAMVSHVELGRPLATEPGTPDLYEQLGGQEQLRLDDVARRSGLPVLLLAADEGFDVRDRAQFDGALARLAEDGKCGKLRTSRGWSVRLWPGSAGAAAGGVASADLRGVYSAMIVEDGYGDWLPRPEPRYMASSALRYRRFLIAANDYTPKVGGHVAMHRLCDRLNALGYDAKLFPMGPNEWTPRPPGAGLGTNEGWSTPLAQRQDVDDDAVVIYPEGVAGNPLGARNVVRWLLNRPGRFTNGRGMEEDPQDLQVSWDPQMAPGLPILWVPVVDPRDFFPKDIPSSGRRLLWVYKGDAPAELRRGDVIEITRSWPEQRRQLGNLLRSASELLSCDWCSGMNHEAAMCGTPTRLVGASDEWTLQDVERSRLGPTPMIKPEGTSLDGLDGDTTVFEKLMDYSWPWAAGLARFVELANDHFSSLHDVARR